MPLQRRTFTRWPRSRLLRNAISKTPSPSLPYCVYAIEMVSLTTSSQGYRVIPYSLRPRVGGRRKENETNGVRVLSFHHILNNSHGSAQQLAHHSVLHIHSMHYMKNISYLHVQFWHARAYCECAVIMLTWWMLRPSQTYLIAISVYTCDIQ
jgi:hypothetical protein